MEVPNFYGSVIREQYHPRDTYYTPSRVAILLQGIREYLQAEDIDEDDIRRKLYFDTKELMIDLSKASAEFVFLQTYPAIYEIAESYRAEAEQIKDKKQKHHHLQYYFSNHDFAEGIEETVGVLLRAFSAKNTSVRKQAFVEEWEYEHVHLAMHGKAPKGDLNERITKREQFLQHHVGLLKDPTGMGLLNYRLDQLKKGMHTMEPSRRYDLFLPIKLAGGRFAVTLYEQLYNLGQQPIMYTE